MSALNVDARCMRGIFLVSLEKVKSPSSLTAEGGIMSLDRVYTPPGHRASRMD